jgi:hypothetical protein
MKYEKKREIGLKMYIHLGRSAVFRGGIFHPGFVTVIPGSTRDLVECGHCEECNDEAIFDRHEIAMALQASQ